MKYSIKKNVVIGNFRVTPYYCVDFLQEANQAAAARPGDGLGDGPAGGAEAEVRGAGEGPAAFGRRSGGRDALARAPVPRAEGEEPEAAQSPVQPADQRKPLVLHLTRIHTIRYLQHVTAPIILKSPVP